MIGSISIAIWQEWRELLTRRCRLHRFRSPQYRASNFGVQNFQQPPETTLCSTYSYTLYSYTNTKNPLFDWFCSSLPLKARSSPPSSLSTDFMIDQQDRRVKILQEASIGCHEVTTLRVWHRITTHVDLICRPFSHTMSSLPGQIQQPIRHASHYSAVPFPSLPDLQYLPDTGLLPLSRETLVRYSANGSVLLAMDILGDRTHDLSQSA